MQPAGYLFTPISPFLSFYFKKYIIHTPHPHTKMQPKILHKVGVSVICQFIYKLIVKITNHEKICVNIVWDVEHFSEEKGVILRYTEKEV